MELVTGVLGTLLPKLATLLLSQYKLQKNTRESIVFLEKELMTMKVALESVSEVPTEQLHKLDRMWARDARELLYDMEDIVDNFLVHVEGPDPPSSSKKRKMNSMLAIGKSHQIGEKIEDMKKSVMQLAERYNRYKVDTVNHVAFTNPHIKHVTSVDPRIKTLYAKRTELVGIDEAKKEIIMNLNYESSQRQKILSIVGFGGIGKTTLAKAVYEEIKLQFDCTAFVTVSQNPDIKKLFKDMLYELDPAKNEDIHGTSLDVDHLIDKVLKNISHKRYFIIIDDIWDTRNWEIIKCALPDDNTGCRIITTTRNVRVAKCIGGLYEMKPLSSHSSKILLHRRIFGNEDQENWFNEEMVEVSDRILKKCAGVPLAIITISSLLASKGRNKIEWDEVCKSIGNGMENSLDAENMRKILSYSYYDLQPHLRICLLYLSMFPEDFKIRKKRLIWLWIAEGFIQHKDQGKTLYESGEAYFNELINRSMIQPMYDDDRTLERDVLEIVGCHVHDMVLDLIRSLSSQENIVTLVSYVDQTSRPTTIRRLSLQHGKADHGTTWGTRSMRQARSFLVFSSAVDQIPTLRFFEVLRVLDLEDCDLSKGYKLEYLGNLLHLRYLSLRNTSIRGLPQEVGKLQFLLTLDVSKTALCFIPTFVAQLKHLMCLRVRYLAHVPNLIGSLKSLEELAKIRIGDQSMENVEALGHLTELRVLKVYATTNKWNDNLAESIRKLTKVQCLEIKNSMKQLADCLDAWDVSRHLRRLNTRDGFWFSKLPALMHHSHIHLSFLRIAVKQIRQENLLILGRLPSLHLLDLMVDHVNLRIYGRFVVGAGLFPCLLRCRLDGFAAPVVFQQGAMPRLTWLCFEFHVVEARRIAGSDGSLDVGLGNLPSLQRVAVFYPSGIAIKEVEERKDAVRKEVEIHPNRPTLHEKCFLAT